jgi:Fur family zinc uptake transcriptional regulator
MKDKMKDNIEIARRYCEKNGHRFTLPRKYVLSILLNSKNPIGAYDILEKLGEFIDKPKPPTAYRALDFWQQQGFVHKIESLNVYMACCDDHAHHNHDTHFLVCDDCHSVNEIHHHPENNVSLPTGFVVRKTFTETHGICGACAK